MDRPNRRFVNRFFGIEQDFVQMHQRVMKLYQRLPNRFLLRRQQGGFSLTHGSHNNMA